TCALPISQEEMKLFKISGNTIDNNKEILSLIDIKLSNNNNSIVKTTTSDLTGNFVFDSLIAGQYNLEFSALEMKTKSITVNVLDNNIELNEVVIDYISATELKDVTIVGNRIPVQQKDDTTQYDAGAYKTNKDASAEDLLKKMPGM